MASEAVIRSLKLRSMAILVATFSIFAALFLFSWHSGWEARYQRFGVPTVPYPGADSRTIQVAAYCASRGFSYIAPNDCSKRAEIVVSIYPEAVVPLLNYPSLWPRFYGLFGDYSESFYRLFWIANALLFVGAVALLSWRYSALAFPLAIFSPVALLAVERGNIDASVFFVTFAPMALLPLRAKRSLGFFLGLATALKLYPVFSLAALVHRRKPWVDWRLGVGLALAAPLIFLSVREMPEMVARTPQAFSTAYGLMSARFAPHLGPYADWSYAAILLYAVIWLFAVIRVPDRLRQRADFLDDMKRMDERATGITLVSLCIFLGTFMVFTNWAYRLIFLIPAFIVLAGRLRSPISKAICANILFIWWIPILPHGWFFENLGCYSLALLSSVFAIAVWSHRGGQAGGHATVSGRGKISPLLKPSDAT